MVKNSPLIFITGGSSGIGLAIAMELARVNERTRLALFARDPIRLADAAKSVLAKFPDATVHTYSMDVSDPNSVSATLDHALADLGPPDRLYLSAGMTLPGRWDRLSVAQHREVLETNYFGCLAVVHHLSSYLSPGAAVAFIGSSAGLVPIHGYSAYSPSKFALRALAETLRIELAPRQISVTLCMPPDTDTPMLTSEATLRPVVTRKMAGDGRAMSASDVARLTIEAVEAKRFLVLPGMTLKLIYLLGPLLSPLLRWWQARLLRKFGED